MPISFCFPKHSHALSSQMSKTLVVFPLLHQPVAEVGAGLLRVHDERAADGSAAARLSDAPQSGQLQSHHGPRPPAARRCAARTRCAAGEFVSR